MSNILDKIKKNDNIQGIAFILVLLLIGLLIFLFSKTDGHSGWQILGQEGGGFWLGILIAIIVTIGCGIVGIRKYNRTQESKSLIVPIVIAAITIAIVFGKGCGDKANDGVTTSQGRPAP